MSGGELGNAKSALKIPARITLGFHAHWGVVAIPSDMEERYRAMGYELHDFERAVKATSITGEVKTKVLALRRQGLAYRKIVLALKLEGLHICHESARRICLDARGSDGTA